MNNEKSPMIKLGALWEYKKQNGEVFFKGRVGDATLIILWNKYKEEGDNKPSWNVFIGEGPSHDSKTIKTTSETLAFSSPHEGTPQSEAFPFRPGDDVGF